MLPALVQLLGEAGVQEDVPGGGAGDGAGGGDRRGRRGMFIAGGPAARGRGWCSRRSCGAARCGPARPSLGWAELGWAGLGWAGRLKTAARIGRHSRPTAGPTAAPTAGVLCRLVDESEELQRAATDVDAISKLAGFVRDER